MKVTPLDLRQQKFKTVMRGYDRGEVSAFLLEAADDYETALRENDKLRQENTKLDAVLSEHRTQERNLKNTLMTAQKLADEIKDHANQEAARILREAEGRCDLLLQKAQGRLEDVQREIDGLRMKRREVETSIEALIATLHNTLEYIHDQDARAREEKVLLHRPRMAEVPDLSKGPEATAAGGGTHAPEPLKAAHGAGSAAAIAPLAKPHVPLGR
jgi:cell division initiation protein